MGRTQLASTLIVDIGLIVEKAAVAPYQAPTVAPVTCVYRESKTEVHMTY